MKVKMKHLIVGLGAIVVVLAAAVICYTQVSVCPIQEDTEPFSIQMVSRGVTDVTDSADLDALAEALRQYSGKRRLTHLNSIELDDSVVCVDGKDADGPVHFVLKADRCVFYRSADSGYVILNDAETLYDAVQALLEK